MSLVAQIALRRRTAERTGLADTPLLAGDGGAEIGTHGMASRIVFVAAQRTGGSAIAWREPFSVMETTE